MFVAASAVTVRPSPAPPRRPRATAAPCTDARAAATSVARACWRAISSVRPTASSTSIMASSVWTRARLASLAVTIRALAPGSATMVTSSDGFAPRPRAGWNACWRDAATAVARAWRSGINCTGRWAVAGVSIFPSSSPIRSWSSFVARTTIELLLRSALIPTRPGEGVRPRRCAVAARADVRAEATLDASACSSL